MIETIHFFVKDKAFQNPATLVAPLQTSNGICSLTQQVLAAYLSPIELKDPRTARVTILPFGNSLSVATDGATSVSDFVENYTTVWAPYQNVLFALIDQLCMNFTSKSNAAAWDTFLSSNSIYSIYQKGTLSFSATQTSTNVFLNGATTGITVPDFVSFCVAIPVNGTVTQFNIYFWMNSAVFVIDYPVSIITAITIPLTFTDLLNKSLTTNVDNALAVAAEASNTIYSDLTVPIPSSSEFPITEGVSGYYTYNAKVVDTNNNFIFMPFNVLYKGAQPGILQIRQNLKAILLNSGVGTQALWQARIPELFVNAQYYLIPIWDNTESLPDSTVYPDIQLGATMLKNTGLVMYDVTSLFISQNWAVLVAAWNAIMMAAIPDPNNASNRLNLITELPDYQYYATTDVAAFNLMPALTKSFSIGLNNALPIAAGIQTSNAFGTAHLNNRTFITFTAGDVEYYIITKESYLNLVSSGGMNNC